MKKQILAAALLLLALTLPTQAAKRQKPNTPQQLTFQHPWQGKRVAYFGDSITDPDIKASKVNTGDSCSSGSASHPTSTG